MSKIFEKMKMKNQIKQTYIFSKHFFAFFTCKNQFPTFLQRIWETSWWHSAQSNHFLQQGAPIETWALETCLHILELKIKW
jgi:hypothetical protein